MTTLGDHWGLRIERSNETHWDPQAEMLLNLEADLKRLYDHQCAHFVE